MNRNIVGVLDLKKQTNKRTVQAFEEGKARFIGLLNVSIAMEACVAPSVHRQEQLQSLCGNTGVLQVRLQKCTEIMDE